MNINNAKLQISAVEKSQYPELGKPEFVFMGKSNVGKSSLINYLLNRKSMARVSSKPGKTRVINFYNIDDKAYFVDLPGYGYAKVSKKERESWSEMVDSYLYERRDFRLFLLIIDIRHEPGEMDLVMMEWLKKYALNYAVIASKADQLNLSERQQRIESLKNIFNLPKEKMVIPLSAMKKFGRDELWELIRKKLDIDSIKGDIK
ncbi:MAG: ribosome biogenesis GTP-binding protein YihA/YsxC [Deltaproteobacteria bacterium]